jgi:hypothetical protein
MNDALAAPAALTAFLRGIERRGAVFAQLQAGDLATGDRALEAAMRAFQHGAASAPVADWPRRFWTLLLAAPPLRETPAAPHWSADFAFLAGIGRGPRAALLLRLVAGLAEADAAAVLGIARPTYRLALQRALPHGANGEPDAEAWRHLGDAAQHAVRELSVQRLAHLARLREAALSGRRLEARPAPVATPVASTVRAPRWRWPAMLAVGVATLLALAATFFLPGMHRPDIDTPRIQVEALPATTPAATYAADAALVTDPDFDLVAADRDAAPVDDPAFHAWLAAGATVAPVSREDDATRSATPPPDVDESNDDAPSESDDAPL